MAAEVEEAVVAGRNDLARLTRTLCSCKLVHEICPSVGGARSCSKWGHLCSD